MACTEVYKKHIMYTFNGFCQVVIRNAAVTAWRDQHRRHKREITTKLGQVLLRPAVGFSSALDFLAQGAAVRTLSYWYILTFPLYYFTFRVRQIERIIGK